MKNFFNIKQLDRIKVKIILIIMIASSIGLILFSAISTSYQIGFLKRQIQSNIESQIDVLATNLVAAVLFEDDESTVEILRSIEVDPNIVSVEVYSIKSDFEVFLVNSSSSYRLENTRVGPVARFFVSVFRNDKEYNREILDREDKIGDLKIFVSNQKSVSQITNLILLFFLVLVLTLAVVFLVSLRIQRIITQPIERLGEASKKISATQDYSIRIELESNDEIGLVSREFNSMLNQIQQRDLMLESKVQSRTLELEKLAEEFRHRAYHDSLTGLPNRALLTEKFPKAIVHAERINRKVGLLLIDVDNFKTINDTLGHEFGDEMLKILAGRLTRNVRGEDLVCRLGGDEFILLIEELKSVEDLNIVGENLFKTLEKDIFVKGKRIEVGISVGGSLYPDHGADLTKIKRAADIAMYYSKDSGKNQYHVFESKMEEAAIHRLTVQNGLKTAIQEEQLVLYYQPKVNRDENRLIGCEILIRWQHPQYGLLFPDTFIPYAEEGGQMQAVDYYVMEKAFAQAAKWSLEGNPITVAINVSGAHFHNHKLTAKLVKFLGKYNLDPSLIEIELTEAVLISDPKVALEVVKVIKSLGIKVALDDFGVGYSSLSYLRTFPVDTIKLDKSFILGLLDNEQDKKLTKGVISLAKGLELGVIAEGVETEQHANYLLEIGCECHQGYLYMKPSPIEEFERWMRSMDLSIRSVG